MFGINCGYLVLSACVITCSSIIQSAEILRLSGSYIDYWEFIPDEPSAMPEIPIVPLESITQDPPSAIIRKHQLAIVGVKRPFPYASHAPADATPPALAAIWEHVIPAHLCSQCGLPTQHKKTASAPALQVFRAEDVLQHEERILAIWRNLQHPSAHYDNHQEAQIIYARRHEIVNDKKLLCYFQQLVMAYYDPPASSYQWILANHHKQIRIFLGLLPPDPTQIPS